MSEFYHYFKENMESMGLPAPDLLFGSLSTAVATAAALLSQIKKFGTHVTVGELVRIGASPEEIAVVGACSAAFYSGAVIGSIAVANGRILGKGTSVTDVLFSAYQHQLDTHWLADCLHAHPGIYRPDVPNKALYRLSRYIA